jgi:hypothetical protein
MTPVTSAPEPISTQDGDFEAQLDQAASEAPFMLLVPDETKLPFEIEPVGLEIIPSSNTQPFVISGTYRVQGEGIRITQSSQIGQIPAKAVKEPPVRGVVGYWVVLNTADRILYWEEFDSALTIGGDLADEDILTLAEGLARHVVDTTVIEDGRPTNPEASRVVEDLAQQGFDLQLTSTNPPTAWLAPAPGVAYQVGDGWLHIHWYADEQEASQKADEIIAEPRWAVIDWAAEPHFFRCGAVIALYLGSDEAVLAVMQGTCGAPFASGARG